MTDTTTSRQQALVLALEADTCAHLALRQLRVPLVKRLAVSNAGEGDLVAVDLQITPAMAAAEPWRGRVELLRAGTTHNLDAVDLVLDGGTLAALAAPTTTTLHATARVGEAVV